MCYLRPTHLSMLCGGTPAGRIGRGGGGGGGNGIKGPAVLVIAARAKSRPVILLCGSLPGSVWHPGPKQRLDVGGTFSPALKGALLLLLGWPLALRVASCS